MLEDQADKLIAAIDNLTAEVKGVKDSVDSLASVIEVNSALGGYGEDLVRNLGQVTKWVQLMAESHDLTRIASAVERIAKR